MNTERWVPGTKLKPEDEADYLKDLCECLRNQQTLSEPVKDEYGRLACEVVPDELAAHAADVIEELFERVQNLKYELRECKAQ